MTFSPIFSLGWVYPKWDEEVGSGEEKSCLQGISCTGVVTHLFSFEKPFYLKFQIDVSSDEKLTSKELIQKIYNLATALQALECGKGTIVGIMSENRHEYPIIVLGTILTGATITCFNPAYTSRK